jgi:hypothetical protein
MGNKIYKSDKKRQAIAKLKINFEQNQTNLFILKNLLVNNGVDKVQEVCSDLRIDIDLSTEKLIQKIHEQRDELLKEVDSIERDLIRKLGNILVS